MSDPLAPLPREAFDFKAAQHLLNRAGFGGTPSQVRALAALGVEGAVGSLFPRRSTAPTLAQLSKTFRSDLLLKYTTEAGKMDIRQYRRMVDWWLRRLLVEAENAFEEKMVLFWHGHFATGFWSVRNSWHQLMQLDLFRREHAGSFERLVRGIVKDPAMLVYLDGPSNAASSPNENLARELFELFTMGEGNGYTEADVKQAARALTGWTVRGNSAAFDPKRHDGGTKTILGQTGKFGTDALVNAILRREEPPRLLARKLYRFFVNDHPNPSRDSRDAIDAIAREIRRNGYQLKPVLVKLFRSAHFYASANRLSVIKSPIQLLAQTSRSLGTPLRSLEEIRLHCELMGQTVLQPPNVKGWEGGRLWCSTSTLVARQNASIYQLTSYTWYRKGSRGSEPVDYLPSPLLADLFEGAPPADVRTCLGALAEFVLGTPIEAPRLDALVQHVRQSGGVLNDSTLRGALCLITCLPEHQLC